MKFVVDTSVVLHLAAEQAPPPSTNSSLRRSCARRCCRRSTSRSTGGSCRTRWPAVVTLDDDLARAADGLVETAPIDRLL